MHKAKEILKKSIREIVKEKISFEVLKEVCINQYEKYKDNNMFITPLMEKLPNVPFGIPVSIKDNFLTKDVLTTCGSKMLSNFVAPYDATVVHRLKNINCVLNQRC